MAYQLNELPFQAAFERFDLIQFSRDVAEHLEQQLDTQRIEFVSNVESHMVYLDRSLLRRIFIALINNALSYSAEEVNFRVHADQDKVSIHITDFGRGIPDEDEPYVFQLFYRGGNIEDVPGFGLGLSVVKSAVEAMNGTVQINSREHQRTTVTLRIPNHFAAEEPHDE